MSLVSNLIKWTPKIVEATADDIAIFGPQAARVRALLNFIPTMSDDAAEISGAVRSSTYKNIDNAQMKVHKIADKKKRGRNINNAHSEAAELYRKKPNIRMAVGSAGLSESVSDLITPEVYRTLTNPAASARALDRLAGRAPESFVPIARDLGERGLVTAPSDIVTARRIAGLPPQQQTLIMGLVDSGLTLEESMLAMRALS